MSKIYKHTVKKILKDIPESVLVEYQKSQDSAEHHNQMIWILTPVLLGFSLFSLEKSFSSNIETEIRLMLTAGGILALFYFMVLIESANHKKHLKYGICKKIEDRYNFYYKQHNQVEKLAFKNELKNYDGMRLLRLIIYLTFITYIGASVVLLYGISNLSIPLIQKILGILGSLGLIILSIIGIVVLILFTRVRYGKV